MKLAVFALLVGIAWLPIPSAISAPRWAVVSIGAAALLWSCRVRWSPAHSVGLALVLWALVSSAWAISPNDAYNGAWQLLVLGFVFCVAAESPYSLNSFAMGLGAAATVNAAIAVAQTLFDAPIFLVPGIPTGYPSGLFGNKNYMAQFGALALVAMIFVPRDWRMPSLERVPGAGMLRDVLIAGSAVAAFLPLSRGAIIAVAVAIGASWWRGQNFRWIAFFGLAGGAVLALVGIDMWLHPERIELSAIPRLEIWDWTLTNLRFFGWGAGNYAAIFPFDHALNDWFEIAFDLGAVGALALAAIVFYCLRERAVDLAAEWAVLVAFLVEGATASPLHQPATAAVGAFVAGRLAGAFGRARRAQSSGGGLRPNGACEPWSLGIGTVVEADVRRGVVPMGPESAPSPGRL